MKMKHYFLALCAALLCSSFVPAAYAQDDDNLSADSQESPTPKKKAKKAKKAKDKADDETADAADNADAKPAKKAKKGKDDSADDEVGGELPQLVKALQMPEYIGKARPNEKALVYFVYQSRSTCGICVAEAPDLVATYKKMKGKGAELVMINIDRDKAAAEAWVKKAKMTFPVIAPGTGGRVPFPYTGQGLLPCMVAMDADGNKLGEANARNVAGFVAGWRKLVSAEKAKKAKAAKKAAKEASKEAKAAAKDAEESAEEESGAED